jgi:hypothetical protein
MMTNHLKFTKEITRDNLELRMLWRFINGNNDGPWGFQFVQLTDKRTATHYRHLLERNIHGMPFGVVSYCRFWLGSRNAYSLCRPAFSGENKQTWESTFFK